MMKRYEALNWASSFLESKGRYASAAEDVLCEILNINRSELYATMRESIDEKVWCSFKDKIEQHGQDGAPIQHLLGYEWFYGRRFNVNRHVLIPRPETEELVQGILQRIKKLEGYKNSHGASSLLKVIDVGTGSGAIAITLSLEHDNLDVSAVDISHDALDMARENALNLGAEVTFYHSDLLESFIGVESFDVIVSNPPYIPISDLDTLDVTVKDHEPHLALFGGEDGYDFYKKICQQLPYVIKDRAIIGFEIGHGQGALVSELIKNAFNGNIQVDINLDINGKERMVFARYGF